MVIQEGPGSLIYENWKDALAGAPWQLIQEYPLFTDAHIVGEISEGLGPYQIINTVPIPPSTQPHRPALVLRAQSHLSFQMPEMNRTDDERYHGGSLADEIAALIALTLGIRLKACGENRIFLKEDDPKGRPVTPSFTQDPILPTILGRPILKSALGTHSLEEASLICTLPTLSSQDVIVLIRAARMYQEAIWIIESTPELSWIMLTSAIETVANRWRATRETPLDSMRASRPDLEKILRDHGDDEFVLQVANQIAPYMGSTKKFIDFILEFLPPAPSKRPPEFAQHSWAPKPMKETMSKIYSYRSRALHGGHPFPAPMCQPPLYLNNSDAPEEIPFGFATSMKGSVWVAKDIPMLLNTFEYIVRHAMLKWWKSAIPT